MRRDKTGKSNEKSSGKSRGKSRGKPVPQPHGGALVPAAGRGPAPGAPNAGRPPSAVRALLRESFAARVPLAEAIADDTALPAAERLRALDLLARYGLGTTREVSTEEVRARLSDTIAAVRQLLPESHAETLLTRLREIWK